MNRFFAFFLALCFEISASGAVYYVDPATGSDSNNGTATGTPWAHVPGSVGVTTGSGWPSSLNNGDKVIVKGGSTNNFQVFLANGAHDSYTGFCNGSAAFDSIVIQSGDRFSPQWGTTQAIFDGGWTNLWGFAYDTGSTGVTIDGFEIRNIGDALDSNLGQGSAGVEMRSSSFWTIRRCWIHDCLGHADDHGHGIEGGQGSPNFIFAQNHIGPNIGSKSLETLRFSNGAITNNFFDSTKYQGDHILVIATFATNLDIANNFIYFGANAGANSYNGYFTNAGNNNYGEMTFSGTDHCDTWNNIIISAAPSTKGVSAFYCYGYNVTNRFFHNVFALAGDKNNNGAGAMVAHMKQHDTGSDAGNETGLIWQNNILYKGGDSDGNIQWCIPWASLMDHENVQYTVFWGGVSTTENVMGYRPSGTGNDILSTVAAYSPGTVGSTYANLMQVDPVLTAGTLPTALDANYHPNQPYFQLTATSPNAVTNTANAVTGNSVNGWVHTSTKFVADILGNTRTRYSMGAYEFGGAAGADPSITQQPTSQTVYSNYTATFTVMATGNTGLSYQWNWFGTNVTGATASSWTTPATVPGQSGSSVYVTVTDTAGSLQSATATLTVNPDPVITTQPAAANVAVGQTATFSVVAAGATALSYQWNWYGTNVTSATASSWTTPVLVNGNIGSSSVYVTVSDTGNSLKSSTVNLNVTFPGTIINVQKMTINGNVHLPGSP